ncbi:hypothetical protein C2845_PM15G04340 [Panicum miliaceum]|uniref:PB1-like domain-containing protein n=1 Tax=Panicum miliaceum TaxID=4540 RepID=A0A3L6Q7B0_PANMI|nr:hypothetical protein C2845_PM15G04340 [Panicum miliaceum]
MPPPPHGTKPLSLERRCRRLLSLELELGRRSGRPDPAPTRADPATGDARDMPAPCSGSAWGGFGGRDGRRHGGAEAVPADSVCPFNFASEEFKVLQRHHHYRCSVLTMAADIWTINLVCEGAAPGQKNVQREMDRDEICFFNLIDLIEEYGYTSIDYLYYKRRDNLVALQLDTNVMEMLEENESKKNVSLFVTRQRIATIAPTKFNKEPSKSAANKAKEKSGTKKKKQLNVIQSKQQYANEVDHQHDDDGIQETSGIIGNTDVNLFLKGDNNKVIRRKRTVLAHVWDLPEENRILVKCNQLWQPIGNEGGLLGQFLGTISRNDGYCPIHIKDWRKVKNDNAETILQCIQTKFLYPRSCEKWILKLIGRDWRKYKATLKNDIDEHQWKALVKYWKSAKGKELSEKNKVSHGTKKTAHTAGTKSYARWSENSIDHDKFQNHVVSSNRKRVRCAEPNHADVVCQQRDELCQSDGNHIGFSDQEAQPSSPQCSTNDFRQKEFDVCTRNSSDGRITRKRKQETRGVTAQELPVGSEELTEDHPERNEGEQRQEAPRPPPRHPRRISPCAWLPEATTAAEECYGASAPARSAGSQCSLFFPRPGNPGDSGELLVGAGISGLLECWVPLSALYGFACRD